MTDRTNPSNQDQSVRFSYYNCDFKITQRILQQETDPDNVFISTAQKVVKVIGIVIAASLESLKNAAKLIANGFIFLANTTNDWLNSSTLKTKPVEVLHPVSSDSATRTAVKPDLAPLEIEEKDVQPILTSIVEVPPSPTDDLDGIPFADLVPSAPATSAEIVKETVAETVTIPQAAATDLPSIEELNASLEEEPSTPVSPKGEESDDVSLRDANDGSLEIELPQEIADRILKKPEAPTYRAFDPRRAIQWLFKKAA